MVVATDLFHMMDPSGAPQNVNFDEPVATFDARYVVSGAEAPVGAEYVVISLDGDLTDERVLTGTANQISIADGGAGGNVTLSTPQDIHTGATPEFDGLVISSADGIDCNPGADIDTDLISIGVTGNPLLKWDESENAFDFSTIIALPTTTSTVGQIKQNGSNVFHSYGTKNMFIGLGSGNFTLTGTDNIAVGENTMAALTSGSYNVVMGSLALISVTSGEHNVAHGRRALESTTIGYNNMAIGPSALRFNTEGFQNVAIGSEACAANTTGINNMGIGRQAIFSNQTGDGNVAIGALALALTTGDENAAIGYYAGNANTSGLENVAIGAYSFRRSETGNYNVAIGAWAGYGVAANSYSNNTMVGFQSGYVLTVGSNNILLGYKAGDVITSGDDNIIIGYDLDPSGAAVSDELNIGALIMGYLAAHGSGPAINLMGGTPQAQQAHIVDADGTLADITAKFNTLLADLEGYGLLAVV